MKRLRQIVTWMLLLSVLLSLPAFAAEEKIAVYQDNAHISVNGNYMNAHNYSIDGNLYVPLQEPKINKMEYQSPPTPKAASFMVYKDDLTIRVNGAVFETPHFLYNGTTYVPLQFFYQALKCHIYEDHSIGVVKIYSPEFVSFGENEVFYYDGQLLTKEQLSPSSDFWIKPTKNYKITAFSESTEKAVIYIISPDGPPKHGKAYPHLYIQADCPH